MEKNMRKIFESTKGITLIALVITIIVLLILASVSLSMVLSQDGIFSRAEQATDKYGQAKARETLELALSDAQIQKYTTGLTDTELDNKIKEIEGELLPKEKPNKNLQNVIVEGYIFEIDRSVPKIVDYIGPADGVIITAMITGNDGWVKPGETVSVSGMIKTYSGGTITSSNATVTKGSTTISNFPTTGGNYTIANISEDTDIKITATDSNGKSAEKTINVIIKRDGTAPTVETIIAKAERLKIKFNATGHDKNAEGEEESGIDYFTYTISSAQDTSLEGIPTDKRTGTFKQGQTVEIETSPTGNRDETKYIITVTATDNCDNTTLDANAKTANVTTIDGITVAEAKQITEETIQENLGKKVIDYIPEAGGTWRVFYYDKDGYFGNANKIYLKMDSVKNETLKDYKTYVSSDDGKIMQQMNPMWYKSSYSAIDTVSEHCASYLCDPEKWQEYCDNKTADFAIGAPSIEMFIKAFEIWDAKNTEKTTLTCSIFNQYGYEINGTYGRVSISQDKRENFLFKFDGKSYSSTSWFCSPSAKDWHPSPHSSDGDLWESNIYDGTRILSSSSYSNTYGICPVICLK